MLTLPFGAYRQETFGNMVFMTNAARNQDIELNYRIRPGGGRCFANTTQLSKQR